MAIFSFLPFSSTNDGNYKNNNQSQNKKDDSTYYSIDVDHSYINWLDFRKSYSIKRATNQRLWNLTLNSM